MTHPAMRPWVAAIAAALDEPVVVFPSEDLVAMFMAGYSAIEAAAVVAIAQFEDEINR